MTRIIRCRIESGPNTWEFSGPDNLFEQWITWLMFYVHNTYPMASFGFRVTWYSVEENGRAI